MTKKTIERKKKKKKTFYKNGRKLQAASKSMVMPTKESVIDILTLI